MSSGKWIVRFACVSLAILLTLIAVAYVIDPLFQFRYREGNAYELPESAASGLLANFEYNMLIIGSSMTQNFNMDTCRELLSCEPLHVGIGGIYTPELEELLQVAYRTGKAEKYYICIDLYLFEKEYEQRLPRYLFKDDIGSKIRYLLSNEVWFRYLPLDVGLELFRCMGIKLPSKLNINSDVDKYCYWGDRFSFGEDIVIDNYSNGQYGVSEVKLDGLYERMESNVDEFLASLDFEKGEHIFFFPPYSTLYWCDAQKRGYFDVFLNIKEYFVNRANECGAIVYDFQSADLTVDLDNYKDTTHYSPEINDWMLKCFANKENIVTVENISVFKEGLIENVEQFVEEHAFLFD